MGETKGNCAMWSLEGTKVLITGGTGFLSSHLARACIRAGSDVHLVSRPTASVFRLKEIADDVMQHWIDLTDLEALIRLLKSVRPEVIFNTARVGSHSALADRTAFFMGNILTAHNLLQASSKVDYRCLVHIGSSSEYGPKDKSMHESDLLEPTTYFGATKAAATLLFQATARELGLPIVILRGFNLFGPWDIHTRLIPSVIIAALKGRSVSLTRPGLRRDYVFIEDFVRACMTAARVGNLHGEIINVASGVETSNEEVVAKIEHYFGKKIEISKDTFPQRAWDTETWVGDNSKASAILGRWCEVGLDDGLRKTIQWFRENIHYYECL